MSSVERAFHALNRWVLIVLLVVMAVLVFANVVSRYAFGHSFGWVEEITRYMMIWVAFLGAGPALRVGGHIAVDSLQDALPAAPARVLRTLVLLIMAVTLVVMIWIGIDYALFGWEQETPVLSLSFGKMYLAIPVGFALMLVHLMLIARRYVVAREFEREEGFDPQAL